MKQNFRVLILASCSILVIPSGSINAEDYNRPIPGSASEIESPMDQGFGEKPEPETKLSELLKSSEVTLKLRNYYLNRDKPNATDPIGWAQGGILSHKMGRLGGYFSMTTEVMGTYPLYASDDHAGTLLFDNEQNSITTLGVANPRVTAFGNVFSAFRQRYNLPYVNEQDNRMIPNTFEGYTIGQPMSTSKKFQYIAGYIDNMKKRDSEHFISMSDAAGVEEIEQGMYLGGARVYFIPDWSLAAANYYVNDVLNIVYAESIYKSKFSEEFENAVSAQFSNQTSVGEDLLTGESFSTGFWGIQDALSYKGAVLKFALNVDEETSSIRAPFGSYPGYNSVIVEDFNRAGELSWQIGLSYDLGKIGLDGFKIATAFIQGNDAQDDATGQSLADKNETDVTLDYRMTEGPLNGLWVRLRSATIDDEDTGTTQDYRVILNYDITLFSPEKPAV